MLLGTLGASSLRNLFTGKGIVRTGFGHHSLSAAPLNCSTSYGNKKGKGVVRAGYGKEWNF